MTGIQLIAAVKLSSAVQALARGELTLCCLNIKTSSLVNFGISVEAPLTPPRLFLGSHWVVSKAMVAREVGAWSSQFPPTTSSILSLAVEPCSPLNLFWIHQREYFGPSEGVNTFLCSIELLGGWLCTIWNASAIHESKNIATCSSHWTHCYTISVCW